MNYQKINTWVGLLIGIVATTIYAMTMEASVSFWDCGEFIPGSLKMQVVHPPGAPLFLFIAHFFALFASSPEKIAICVNFSSALATGLAIMFLFWTITALARKIVLEKGQEPNTAQLISILGSGIVGAMAACFADGIWFSAVEGEVYAMSLFFTSIVFWAILKWENHADEKYADRWIVLIAFLMGLSTGVHLLNLLTIPAIAMVYYFKRYEVNTRGIIISFLIGCGLLGFVQFGVIQQLPQLSASFDRMFVNGFSMPKNSGVVFFFFLVAAILIGGIWYTKLKQHTIFNTFILSIAFIVIGYSSVLMVPIRSLADPPIDMNNPEDAFSLLSYLNREQYGDRPLFKGPIYTAQPIAVEDGETRYYWNESTKKYEENGHKPIYKYDDADQMLFPRIYDSQDPQHVRFYQNWLGLSGDEKPTFGDNLKFFFGYQVKFMYFRYFMWNFSGRQNDIQGHGNDRDGNWITGIDAIDNKMLKIDASQLSGAYENNKGTNKYFMLPFILGLIGLYYHYKKNRRDAFVVGLLFFMTGLAILLYLNQTPLQPRERDYSYAGSFYAFAIWIGLAVLALADWIGKRMKASVAAPVIALVLCFAGAPYIMGQQNWDDHDRSTRYTAHDFARNYLESCAPNAILFTQGDNDTYPLWYAQEAEGIRKDIRIINLSLLGVDWYVDQLAHKNNDADPVPIIASPETYRGQNRDYLRFYDAKKFNQNAFYNLADVLKFVYSNDQNEAQLQMSNGEFMNYMPVKNIQIPVSKENCLAQGITNPFDTTAFPSVLQWKLNKNTFLKNDLITLDIIAANMWKRPIYFAVSVSPDALLGLDDYMQLEGLTNRLTPFKNNQQTMYPITGRVNTDLMYNNIMNKYTFGGIQNNNVYLDENIMRMAVNLQSNMGRLAEQLIAEGKKDKAVEVLDKCLKNMPKTELPYSVYMIPFVESYYRAGKVEKAHEIANELRKGADKELAYYYSLPNELARQYDRDMQENLYLYQMLQKFSAESQDTTYLKDVSKKFEILQKSYSLKVQ